jgi:hypothetical protein
MAESRSGSQGGHPAIGLSHPSKAVYPSKKIGFRRYFSLGTVAKEMFQNYRRVVSDIVNRLIAARTKFA